MSQRLRVMHVVRALRTGGLEMLALEMSARARRQGVEARVCALLPGDDLAARPEYAGVPCVVLGAGWPRTTPGAVLALRALFRRERPDVVHTHNFHAHVRAAAAARLAGVPALVHTKHGAKWPRLLGSRRLAGTAYRRADVVVAVSDDVRRGFLEHYRVPPERVRLVLNGIDTDRFRPMEGDRTASRARLLGLDTRPLLGTVCRLVPGKGIATLLEALAELRERLPGAGLVVVGDGSARAECEAQATRLGLADRVRFLGNRSDAADLYPLFDVYVQPSYAEGISLTLLEACSCALPVVATAVGGNPEIIEDAVCGRLVPPRDARALAGAVMEVWADAAGAARMGRAARERVVERFSLQRMLNDHLALYRSILEAR